MRNLSIFETAFWNDSESTLTAFRFSTFPLFAKLKEVNSSWVLQSSGRVDLYGKKLLASKVTWPGSAKGLLSKICCSLWQIRSIRRLRTVVADLLYNGRISIKIMLLHLWVTQSKMCPSIFLKLFVTSSDISSYLTNKPWSRRTKYLKMLKLVQRSPRRVWRNP